MQTKTTELNGINASNESTASEEQEKFIETPTSNMLNRDYKQTYAEFHQPHKIPEQLEVTDFQYCTQCNKNVPLIEFQMHTDRHIAFQLSQQQRIEYRSQLKIKLSPTNQSPANKRIKIESSKSNGTSGRTKPSSSSSLSLDSFFKRTTEKTATEQASSSDTIFDKEICRYCGKLIAIDSIEIHSDYHAAKRLQFQIDQEEGNTSNVKSAKPLSQISKKPQIKSKNNNTNNKVPTNKLKSITSFFKN